jgi:hypothetical protein
MTTPKPPMRKKTMETLILAFLAAFMIACGPKTVVDKAIYMCEVFCK